MFLDFFNSFVASVIGCVIPLILILLGPIRFPDNLKIFRSNKVIKATIIKIVNTIIKHLVNVIIILIVKRFFLTV